jgi:uncharacterized protein (DUF1800 family)
MFEPLPASQWNEITAAHLLNRAGFGGSPTEIERLSQMGMDAAVSWFIDYERIPDETPAPDWAHPDPNYLAQRQAIQQASDPETRKALQKMRNMADNQQMADLRYWWVRRMALGPRPFQEKMTLFWHGHFATSYEKVRMPYWLWLQNETLRRHATGNFHQLLIAVAEDPAMLRYLDGAQSRKGKPNENFAREVLELFTLGEGHYTEQDIQQSARAYTGWGIDRTQSHYEYHPRNHDEGPETVFGRTGDFSGEDVLNMICDNPQCARFITKKIWRFFVQDQPPAPLIEALAADFHDHGMDLKHLMNVVFRSSEFYAPDVIRSQIKSPIEWLIAGTHQLQAPLPTQPMTLVMLAKLGEELFNPPNVKGWDGGVAWITTNSLMDRYNFAAVLVEGLRVPLPGLKGQMQNVMNGGPAENQLLDITPANVSALFTPDQLQDADQFLAALEHRFINDTLQAQRQSALRDFLKNRFPLQDADIRKAIRLTMCTTEYQLS